MEECSSTSKSGCPITHCVDLDDESNYNKETLVEDRIHSEDDTPEVDGEVSESDGNEEGEYNDDMIHSLLEDGIKDSGDKPFVYTRSVMKQVNDIDIHILPEDWLEITHNSGIPVYLDRKRRVISLSKPYHLGVSSVRRHAIPQSAIPCLNYRRCLVKQGRPLTYDAACITEDIQIEKSIPADEIVVRAPSMTDSLRLPKSEEILKDKQEDMQKNDTQPQTLKNKGDTEESTKGTCGRSVDQKSEEDQIDADVEEGEIISESDDVVDKAKETSRKRPHDGSNQKASADDSVSLNSSQNENSKQSAEKACKKARMDSETGQEVNLLANVETSVISVQEKEKELLLDPQGVQQYCRRLFEFEDEKSFRFKSLSNKYKFLRIMRKITREKPATLMPKNANLIKYKVPLPPDAPANTKTKEFIVNPSGKSFVCILHEYCQVAAKRPPSYQFKELQNSPTPYSVTVSINGTVYGEGFGDSKRRAKLNAAKITLEMIIPGFSKIITQMEEHEASVQEAGGVVGVSQASGGAASAAKAAGLVSGPSKVTGMARGWNSFSSHDLEIFETISINDRRLQEISMRMALPGPYAILIEYLRRQCISEHSIKVEMTQKPNKKNLFTMTVMGETVSVLSKGKKEGRYLAAQALLQVFHPHISTWSGILKLYGPGSKPDRKMDQEVITELQSREKGSVKNSLIDLLKAQMKSLAEEWDEHGELHKGKFYIAPSQLPVIDFHPDSVTESHTS